MDVYLEIYQCVSHTCIYIHIRVESLCVCRTVRNAVHYILCDLFINPSGVRLINIHAHSLVWREEEKKGMGIYNGFYRGQRWEWGLWGGESFPGAGGQKNGVSRGGWSDKHDIGGMAIAALGRSHYLQNTESIMIRHIST